MGRKEGVATKLARVGVGFDRQFGSISVPIYQTAIYRYRKFGENLGYDYSRSENPTRRALEDAIAELEGGARGLAFSSGMAAITAVATLFSPGDEVLVCDDLYGGTYRLFQEIVARYGVTFTYADLSDLSVVEAHLSRGTVKAVFIETPTNPLLKVIDVVEVGKRAKEAGALFIVDSTFLSPYLMRPIEYGADIVVHSATKYLGGHNDLIGGLVVAADGELGERLYFIQKAAGAILGPFDSWVLLRGMKTLAVRMEKAQENAEKLARFLADHPKVTDVYFPGLPDHPGRDVHFRQARGPGAVLSFRLHESVHVPTFFNSLRVVNLAESLGGVESLTTHPATMTHADIPPEEREKLGITDSLVRISVGIEDGDDIVADVGEAIERASTSPPPS
ncbi:MAG: PLP-dependent transferase [Deltaproteobacteria bacterium]|nr:MAG: PLP-dependent transferase [Deltaproteobacteria bacterium]